METLLHTCCGPCACACVPRLKEAGRKVTMLFANSNIDSREEFEKRLASARKVAEAEGVALVALPYDHDEWLREVAAGYESAPERGARCARCFRYSLRKTAEYAAANGFGSYTTSLTLSPHKVSSVVFAAADATGPSVFLPEDFKKREGFKLSVRRAAALGLYRQAYCGCEFSRGLAPSAPCVWRIHHKEQTASTNTDARAGRHGDVFTADFQTAGRGRLDHKWLSPPGTNLMMSVVLSADGLSPDHAATLPLVVGLAVARGLGDLVVGAACPAPLLKWPNDVLIGGKKVAGILCERIDDRIIAGIGVNVGQRSFAPEIADRAVSLAVSAGFDGPVRKVRDAVLASVGALYERWRRDGFPAVHPQVAEIDFLRGRTLAVRQTDDDSEPICGVCGGIAPDGSLDVGGVSVYAGEAHVERIGSGA